MSFQAKKNEEIEKKKEEIKKRYNLKLQFEATIASFDADLVVS